MLVAARSTLLHGQSIHAQDVVATFYIMVVVFHVMVVIYGMARVVSAFAFFIFSTRISLTGNSDSFCKRREVWTAQRTARTLHTQTCARVWLEELNRLQHALFCGRF